MSWRRLWSDFFEFSIFTKNHLGIAEAKMYKMSMEYFCRNVYNKSMKTELFSFRWVEWWFWLNDKIKIDRRDDGKARRIFFSPLLTKRGGMCWACRKVTIKFYDYQINFTGIIQIHLIMKYWRKRKEGITAFCSRHIMNILSAYHIEQRYNIGMLTDSKILAVLKNTNPGWIIRKW